MEITIDTHVGYLAPKQRIVKLNTSSGRLQVLFPIPVHQDLLPYLEREKKTIEVQYSHVKGFQAKTIQTGTEVRIRGFVERLGRRDVFHAKEILVLGNTKMQETKLKKKVKECEF